MPEQTEISPDLEEVTLQIASNSGFDPLINEISTNYSLTDFKNQVLIPIPTELIQEGEFSASIGEDVIKYFNVYQKLINNEKTAFEFPFLITGNSSEVGEIEMKNIKQLSSTEDILKNEILKMSSYSKLLLEGISQGKERDANVYILGHTHPIPSELTENIDVERRNKFHIKELGLNLTLQDLYQLVYFEEATKGMVPPDSKVFISVLMFNGESCFIYIEDGKFKKLKVPNKD